MSHIEPSLSILRNTPRVLAAMLDGLPGSLTDANYGPDTFSPADVVQHLILGERIDWLPRIRIALEHGEDRPFDPFPWDGRDEQTADATMTERLDVFERLRGSNLHALEALDLGPDDLGRTGLHPIFGPVTIGQLVATWGVHDVHHTAQICRAMNYQFRDDIGPWRPHVNTIR